MTRSKQTEPEAKTPGPETAPPVSPDAGDERSEGMVPFKPQEEGGDDDPKAAKPKAKKAKEAKEPARDPEPIPGLVEGRIVHYCLPDGKRRGEHRAAVITYVHDHGAGLVNLNVFLNGDMEYPAKEHPGNNWFVQKVKFTDAPQTEGHWHFIERA